MNKLIYILIAVLVVLTVFFSYRVKDYRFDIFEDTNEVNQDKKEAVKEVLVDVVNKPIVWDAQRKFLTALYRQKHTGDCNPDVDGIENCLKIKPQLIVIHMTDLASLQRSFEYMKEPVLREERSKLISRSYDRVNVSAHFMVDKDGTIYSLMPEDYMARHAIGVNHNSIAIENVGMNSDGPTREQIDSNIKIIKYLMEKYGIKKENIYSHASTERLKESGSPLFKELEPFYFAPKNCGQKILKEIKKRL